MTLNFVKVEADLNRQIARISEDLYIITHEFQGSRSGNDVSGLFATLSA